MAAAGAVMTDGRSHALAQFLVDNHHRHHSFFAMPDSLAGQHRRKAVKTVNDDIFVVCLVMIADDRLCKTVFPNGNFQQFHLRRRHFVGVIVVGSDLFNRNCLHVINRTYIFAHLTYLTISCTFPLTLFDADSASASAKIPYICINGRFSEYKLPYVSTTEYRWST